MKCYSCHSNDEVRPYGPNGAMVCFQCAFATPESTKETNANFERQLNAAGPVVVIGEEVGPYPAKHNPLFSGLIK